MYTLWVAVANKHHSERFNKVVNNDKYVPAGQFGTVDEANRAFVTKMATAAPGTKVKLVGTVPERLVTPADELAALKARIAQLEGKAA